MANLERDLYPIVEKWLKRKFRCFKTTINEGLRFSRADVIGIKDIGGDLHGEIEVIIVEVKRGTEAFATASGQAFGYTVYANRVYLADKRDASFTQEELQIASHLGIGLILINNRNQCQEILTSPFYKPLTNLNTHLLEKLRLGKCVFCNNYIEIGDSNSRYSNVTKSKLNKAIEVEKGLVFWNFEVGQRKIKAGIKGSTRYDSFERRFICTECVSLFGQLKK